MNNHADALLAGNCQTIDQGFKRKRPSDDPDTPHRADAVKNRFHQDCFDKNRGLVIRMWIRLLLQYPRE